MTARTWGVLAAAVALFWAPYALGLPLYFARTNPTHPDLLAGPLELWALLGAPLVALAVVWSAPGDGPPDARPARRRTLWALALGQLALIVLVGTTVTHWAPLTDDEEAYRLQARLLWSGALAEPAFPMWEAVSNPFVVEWPDADGVVWWTGCYPLVAGLLTAIGRPFHFDQLGWIVLGPLLVIQVGRLAEELWPDADGELAAGLLAASPAVVLLGAHMHTSLASTLLAVVSARLLVPTVAGSVPAAVGLGAALGAGVLTRPLDGGWMILLCAGVLAARRRWWAAVPVVAGAWPFATSLIAHDLAITGHPLRMPYSLLSDRPLYGFGETAFGNHTPLLALIKTSVAAVRLDVWTTGWPLLLLAPGAYVALRHEPGPWRVVALAAAGHLALYAAAPFGAINVTGTTYHVWLVPCFVLLLVAGLRHRRARPRVAAATVWAWTTFVPFAAANVAFADELTLEPRRYAQELVAERGPIVVLFASRVDYPPTSYVLFPPVTTSVDDPIVWLADGTDAAEIRARWPDRPVYRMTQRADGSTEVTPVD